MSERSHKPHIYYKQLTPPLYRRIRKLIYPKPFERPGVTLSSLPDSILSEIFIHSYPIYDDTFSDEGYDHYPWGHSGYLLKLPFSMHPRRIFPTIASICRRWRRIAFATPNIWTLIVFSDGRDADEDYLKLCLKLSAGRPLDVFIRPWMRANINRKDFLGVLGHLKPELARVRSFSAQFIFAEELEILFSDNLVDMQRAELIIIYYALKVTALESDSKAPFFGHIQAPKVRYLQLQDNAILDHIKPRTTSLQVLREVCLVGYDFPCSLYLSFLSLCPNLSRLTIGSMDTVDSGNFIDWPITRYTLSLLMELCLFIPYTSDTLYFCRSLYCPALRFIEFPEPGSEFDSSNMLDSYMIEIFHYCYREHAKTLHTVVFTDRIVPSGVNLLEPILKSMENLHQCTFQKMPLPPSILEVLIPGANDSPSTWPCPRLKYLILSHVDIEGDALVRLVKARCLSINEYEDAKKGENDDKSLGSVSRLQVGIVGCSFLEDEALQKTIELIHTYKNIRMY